MNGYFCCHKITNTRQYRSMNAMNCNGQMKHHHHILRCITLCDQNMFYLYITPHYVILAYCQYKQCRILYWMLYFDVDILHIILIVFTDCKLLLIKHRNKTKIKFPIFRSRSCCQQITRIGRTERNINKNMSRVAWI